MHLSRVLLPDPLRPTIPKNSPCGTANDTFFSASSRSGPGRLNGWGARSLRVWTCSRGIVNVFDTPSTTTAGTPSGEPLTGRNVALGPPASAPLAQTFELAPDACAYLPPRARRERVAGHEGREHDQLPELVLALAAAQPLLGRRPPVARQLAVHVREPPPGARQLEVHVVVLDHPLPERVAPDGARGRHPERHGRARYRVLLDDLRELVHRVH